MGAKVMDATYRLQMLNISKSFPGVQALDKVTLEVLPGEVHALVGENGAGKSTLMKILSGAYARDNGQIFLDGQPLEIRNPHQALQQGIVTIYQESNLAWELSIAENIFMGRLPQRVRQWVAWKNVYQSAQKLLDELDSGLDAHDLVKDLSAAQRQMVEIAKALSISARVIVLDEPSAALTDREVEILFQVVDRLRKRGVSIVYISHRLEEIFSIADRVTVLRDGCWVATHMVKEVDESVLVLNMIGRKVDDLYERKANAPGRVVLCVRNLSGNGFHNISFDLHSGEIVGFFGLVGSGRTEVVSALFGAEKSSAGTIELENQRLYSRSPKEAIHAGVALAPEDRKLSGLILGMPVRANISLPSIWRLSRFGFINSWREKALARDYIQKLDIRTPSAETPAQSLSGGNQQKVVIAKWLARQPKVLVLDEPTRGIDVAGKAEVHRLMSNLAEQGVAILMVSSELPEVLGMSDRILVMREGRLAGELARQQATEESIMFLAAGEGENGRV